MSAIGPQCSAPDYESMFPQDALRNPGFFLDRILAGVDARLTFLLGEV